MKQCELCQTQASNDVEICDCGYNFKTGVQEQDIPLFKIPDKNHWVERVKYIRNLLNHLIKREGRRFTDPDGKGWSERRLADDLDISHSKINRYVKLANALDKYPKLGNCINIKRAEEKLNELKTGIDRDYKSEILSGYEVDLKRYLENNWEKTDFYEEWRLDKVEYNTREVGIIDMYYLNDVLTLS